ncbi:MAG: response regulator [Blastocatellia bacterium]
MKPMRVLLIEDDEDDYIVTKRLLGEAYADRLQLVWAKTYDEGLERLSPCDFDVCLLDYRLGARNGIELLREICAQKYPTPIILMTGQGDREVDVEASEAGAADYLLKNQPDAALLERAIRYSIQHKQSEVSRLELLQEREAREMAEQANRAKDDFLAMVTHELRSPLNAILGWTQILRSQKPDAAMLDHIMGIIEKSAQLQSRLIEDILDAARATAGQLRLDVRPVILPEVINGAIEVVRPAADAKNITLHLTTDARVNIVSGDPERLQQVIWNLLSNAIKFTPQDGRVEIHMERADPNTRITIRDNGKGIDKAFLPYIFDRFAQHPDDARNPRRRSGLGLGLALARQLVELHGGTIEATSDGPGQGATFTLEFPIRAIANTPVGQTFRARATSASSVSLADLRVLVVDDQADARSLVSAVLRQAGARVTEAECADEALQLFTGENPFDALVCDIGMPEKDGYALMREVRRLPARLGGQTPAVALTAFGRSVDRIRALTTGFQTHIPKPVEPEELIVVIASLTVRRGT